MCSFLRLIPPNTKSSFFLLVPRRLKKTKATNVFFFAKQQKLLLQQNPPQQQNKTMQNPLDAPTYRLDGNGTNGNAAIYRMNVPWERVDTANPAAAAEFSGGEEEEAEAEQMEAEREFAVAEREVEPEGKEQQEKEGKTEEKRKSSSSVCVTKTSLPNTAGPGQGQGCSSSSTSKAVNVHHQVEDVRSNSKGKDNSSKSINKTLGQKLVEKKEGKEQQKQLVSVEVVVEENKKVTTSTTTMSSNRNRNNNKKRETAAAAVLKRTEQKEKTEKCEEKEVLVTDEKMMKEEQKAEEKTEEIRLVGSVKYDAKQECYHDSLKVASALIGHLRGREGHKQKKLEQKFACSIHFPKKRGARMETEIKISSLATAQHVEDCRVEIEQLLVQARRQAMPSHFVSVPIFDTRLREQYTALVKRICADDELEKDCKNDAIFMPPAKLHLTLGVLKLFTEEELASAKQFLDRLFKKDEKIRELLADGPIRVQFPALEHFPDRAADKVSVLFARAESERMQSLANAIDDALTEAGLTERRRTPDVVLHMTVLNTKYLWEKRRSFLNVKPILDRFGQLDFDPVDVEELHLCEMRGTNDEQNGYKSVHTVHLGIDTGIVDQKKKNSSNKVEEQQKNMKKDGK